MSANPLPVARSSAFSSLRRFAAPRLSTENSSPTGGVGTVPSIQLFTDYQVRLMRYVEFMKRVVPLHDDLFDFFYHALPGYEKVGQRRILLGCWGSFQDPDICDYNYRTIADINLGIRILLGSSYYDDWDNEETFVRQDPLDLAPVMNVSVDALTEDVHTLKPDIQAFSTSCRTGAGLDQVAEALLVI